MKIDINKIQILRNGTRVDDMVRIEGFDDNFRSDKLSKRWYENGRYYRKNPSGYNIVDQIDREPAVQWWDSLKKGDKFMYNGDVFVLTEVEIEKFSRNIWLQYDKGRPCLNAKDCSPYIEKSFLQECEEEFFNAHTADDYEKIARKMLYKLSEDNK